MSSALLAGAILGLSVAAPFGPISLLCVQRSLAGGYRSGVASGFGAATAQGLFAMLAVLGADVAAETLRQWHNPMRLVSAAILTGLGVRTVLGLRRRVQPRQGPVGVLYASALLLGLSNPMTVLPYLAVATAETSALPPSLPEVPWLIGGVMIGASGWYCGVSGAACVAGHMLAGRAIQVLNLIAGGVMIGLGVLVWVR